MSPAAKPSPTRSSAKLIAWGGLLTALSWIFLVLAVYLPQSSLFLRLLAALTLLIAERSIGLRGSILLFLSTSLLAAFYPGFYLSLPYLIYLGPYVLISYTAARYFSPRVAVLLRVFLGCALFLFLASLYGDSLLPATIQERVESYRWPLLILLGILGTACYDYLLALASVAIESSLAPYFKTKG